VPTLVQRYKRGDRERVWHELRQLGSKARGRRSREDAEAVVRDAMTRARDNVVVLIERLRAEGYKFGDPWNTERARVPHAPPDKKTPAFVSWLDKRWGPIPMTVRAWIEIVGDVSLLGVHPGWPDGLVTDPLVVEVEHKSWKFAEKDRLAMRKHFESEYESWEHNQADGGDLGAFALDVAPDALHKANISGGAPYGFLVPDGSVDAMFRYEDGLLLPFIEYLRLVFRCGGFPSTAHRDCGAAVRESCRALAKGLLDL